MGLLFDAVADMGKMSIIMIWAARGMGVAGRQLRTMDRWLGRSDNNIVE
jgi:hypothetical protein